MKWKEYKPNSGSNSHLETLWQMKIDEDLYANVYIYPKSDIYKKTTYELHIQVPEEKSIIGETIDITVFTYFKKDFDLFEKHARKVIMALIKNK